MLRGALDGLGYKFIQSYYDPNLFKTDAPANVLYDVFNKYKKDVDEKEYYKNVKEESYKYKILEKEIKVNPIFVDTDPKEGPHVNKGKYLPDPFPNWGPKARAKEKK